MRRALRRLSSFLVTLVLTSFAALWALSAIARAVALDATAGSSDAARPAPASLPAFFNPAPRNARVLAEAALRSLSRPGEATRAELELRRLGGAALPTLLSRFDTLPPEARGKLALALAPIAARMGIAAVTDFESGESAVAFWTRFWQDRAVDFRPQLVRRLVTRLAEKSSVLRTEDVTQLDTYALPELLAALELPQDREGVARARRLTLVLSHVTENPWVIEAGATPEAARAVVGRWRRFWLNHGADFSNPEGARQVVAMFMETRYAHWLRAFWAPTERGPFGVGALEALRSALGALVALAIALGVAAELTHWLLERLDQRRRIAGTILSVLLASAPVVFLTALFGAPSGPLARHLFASVLSGLSAGAVLSILSARALVHDSEHDRRVTLSHAALALPSTLPWLFTSLLSLEVAFELRTAGRALVLGLRADDLQPGMSVALCSALAVAVFTATMPRLALASAPRRTLPVLLEVGGARKRRAALAGLAWFGLLLALAVVSFGTPREPSSFDSLARFARSIAFTATLTLALSAGLGLLLGALRARPARALDSFLSRAVEVQAALPGALWIAALSAAFGTGVRFALALGALRALDVAWMYRSELVRTALEHRADAPISSRVPAAPTAFRTQRTLAGPLRAAVALTPAWALSLAAAAGVLGVSAMQSGRRLITPPAFASPGELVLGLGLIAGTCAVLLAWAAPLPRKLGALRASWPPPAPDHSASEPPPSSRGAVPPSVPRP